MLVLNFICWPCDYFLLYNKYNRCHSFIQKVVYIARGKEVRVLVEARRVAEARRLSRCSKYKYRKFGDCNTVTVFIARDKEDLGDWRDVWAGQLSPFVPS